LKRRKSRCLPVRRNVKKGLKNVAISSNPRLLNEVRDMTELELKMIYIYLVDIDE